MSEFEEKINQEETVKDTEEKLDVVVTESDEPETEEEIPAGETNEDEDEEKAKDGRRYLLNKYIDLLTGGYLVYIAYTMYTNLSELEGNKKILYIVFGIIFLLTGCFFAIRAFIILYKDEEVKRKERIELQKKEKEKKSEDKYDIYNDL